ncbi:hypothetical protein S7335_2063 [Synechococcus sp. PCC 7335]|nr:hypothetical protein S7335_2063 [Synechococcus sp. PCC 7335]
MLALSNGVSFDSLIQANGLSVDQQLLIIRRYIEQVLT